MTQFKNAVLTAQSNLIIEAIGMAEANRDDLAFNDEQYIDELVETLLLIMLGDHEIYMETMVFFTHERPDMLPRLG